MPASQKTGHYEDVAHSFVYLLSVLHRFQMCRLVRWRIQLFQKLCFTRDFCSKCFLDVNRGVCALFGICSFIAWSGATVWSMTQEKICKPCACTKCKPCCSWQVLPPLLLARTPLLFSHIVSTSVGLAKKETLRNQSLFCYAREIGREGIWTDRGWIRPQCGLTDCRQKAILPPKGENSPFRKWKNSWISWFCYSS